jgi:hypothetical protein
MHLAGILMLFISLLLTPSVNAQQAESLDPAKVEAIRELLRMTGAEANREQLTNTFTQQLISVLQANNTRLTDRTKAVIRDEVEAVVTEQLRNEKLQRKMHRIYARYFTLEELEGLIEFNKSPIGRKANQVMPVLMRESVSAAQSWSEEIGPIMSQRVKERLAQEGVSIGR